MKVIFALHPQHPIACQGNDLPVSSVEVLTEDIEKTRQELQKLYGGYVQVWEIHLT